VSVPAFIELADTASGLRAWLGSGVPGIADGGAVLIAFQGDRLLAAGSSDSGAIELGDDSVHGDASVAGFSLQAQAGGAGEGSSPRAGTAALEIRGGGGDERTLECRAVFGELPVSADGAPADLLRSLTALPGADSSGLAAASSRSQGSTDHGAERIAAWLLDPQSGQARRVEEPLLSTQYDEAGVQSRAGLELWVGTEDHLPLRVAGVRRFDTPVELDGWRVSAAFFRWIVEGAETEGSYLIWRRGDGS
jgi:hypothetical protein